MEFKFKDDDVNCKLVLNETDNLQEVLDHFKDFLIDCEFPICESDSLRLIDPCEDCQEDEKVCCDVEQTVSIDISEDIICKIAIIAHKENVTINDFINSLLKDFVSAVGE